MVIIVLGVSGSGKTTVARELARDLGWNFADADDFHSPEAIARMRSGHPLTDEERRPWLVLLRRAVVHWLEQSKDAVLACSALKASYREALAHEDKEVVFVYLKISRALLEGRLQRRAATGRHFMPPALMESQLADLEEPTSDEAFVLDMDRLEPLGEQVAQIRTHFGL